MKSWICMALAVLAVLSCALVATSDHSEAAVTVTYGSDQVGAELITFDSNGGRGGYSQYVLNGNQVYLPTEYRAEGNGYGQYTQITRDGYVLLGWSESRTAASPQYYPGQAYTVLSDRHFYAVWGDLTYDCIERFGGSSDDIDAEAQHVIVTKGGPHGLRVDEDTGAYILMQASVSRSMLRYILTVEHDGQEVSSVASSTGSRISADWLTMDISRSGELSFSGAPSTVGVYRIQVEMQTKGMGGSYGDLEDIFCTWYVSVADHEHDASVMMHVTYDGSDIDAGTRGFGPFHTAVMLPDSVSQRQKGWSIDVDGSLALFPVGGSYSVVRTETAIAESLYTYDEIVASGAVGIVAYNANGGSYSGAFAELVPVDGYRGLRDGSIVTKPDSVFLGWNASGSAGDPIYPAGYLFDVAGDYTEMKAVWGPTDGSVFRIYLKNPGNGSQDSSFEAVGGRSYYLPVHGFELSGYEFRGWSSVRFDVGSGEPDQAATVSPESSRTYYAVYKPTEYTFTICYMAGAGGGTMSDQTETSTSVPFYLTLRGSAFTPPEGFEFRGWSETKYASSPGFFPGDYYEATGSGSVRLHAVYAEIPVVPDDPVPSDPSGGTSDDPPVNHLFRLRFSGNGQNVINVPSDINRIVASDECALYVPMSAPSRDGYRFVGWSDAPTGLAKYEPNSRIMLKLDKGDTEAVMILYAVWEGDSQGGEGTRVTVTFAGDAGTLRTVSVLSSQSVLPVTAPTKGGFAFLGWYDGLSRWDFARPVTHDMTLTAMYLKVFHVVIDGDAVRPVLDVESSTTEVEFSDGFKRTYGTSSIEPHAVGYGKDGSVTVKVTTDRGDFTAVCPYSTGAEPEDRGSDPEQSGGGGLINGIDNRILIVGAIAVLTVIGILYWRFRL